MEWFYYCGIILVVLLTVALFWFVYCLGWQHGHDTAIDEVNIAFASQHQQQWETHQQEIRQAQMSLKQQVTSGGISDTPY